jgi:hypothetical protein
MAKPPKSEIDRDGSVVFIDMNGDVWVVTGTGSSSNLTFPATSSPRPQTTQR